MRDTDEEFHAGAIPVIGSCVAGRVWRVHDDGVLTGVTHGHPWGVDGNLAFCPYIGADGDTPEQPAEWRGNSWLCSKSSVKPHRPGALGCLCGWWSYHDLTLSESWRLPRARDAYIAGTIVAYGLMTRGTKGYRSERADITAFVRPEWADDDTEREDRPPLAAVWTLITARYAPVPVAPSLDDAMTWTRGRGAL